MTLLYLVAVVAAVAAAVAMADDSILCGARGKFANDQSLGDVIYAFLGSDGTCSSGSSNVMHVFSATFNVDSNSWRVSDPSPLTVNSSDVCAPTRPIGVAADTASDRFWYMFDLCSGVTVLVGWEIANSKITYGGACEFRSAGTILAGSDSRVYPNGPLFVNRTNMWLAGVSVPSSSNVRTAMKSRGPAVV